MQYGGFSEDGAARRPCPSRRGGSHHAGALLLAGCGAANEAAPAGGSARSASSAPTVTGTISGAGASSQQAAMQAWIAGFTGANPDANINYDPSGSGAGRTQFLGGGVAFAGSDACLKAEELTQAQDSAAAATSSRSRPTSRRSRWSTTCRA